MRRNVNRREACIIRTLSLMTLQLDTYHPDVHRASGCNYIGQRYVCGLIGFTSTMTLLHLRRKSVIPPL